MHGPRGTQHRTPRRKVLIRAEMRCGGPKVDICIRDVSPRGMLLQSSAPPPRGTFVEIVQGGLPIVGQVIWMKDRKFGISTRDVIDLAALTQDEGKPGAQPRAAAISKKQAFKPTVNAGYSFENSRHSAKAIQFASVVAVIVCAAGTIAFVLHDRLSSAVANVSAHL